MSDDIASVTVTVEEGSAGIEAGETCSGTIVGTELREVEFQDQDTGEDEEAVYYDIIVRENNSGIEFNPGYNLGDPDHPRVTQGTDLGGILRQFGVDLTIGDEFDLAEIFADGTEVSFEVEEDGDYLRLAKDSLRPAGEEAPDASGAEESSDDDDDDVKADVLAIVEEEFEGQDEGDVKKGLAQRDGNLFQAYKELVSEGRIEVIDGTVLVA